MRSEIDDLLEAMFRGGRLNVKSGAGKVAAAGKNTAQAGKAVESVEALAKQTQQEIEVLSKQLETDGVKTASAVNKGSGQDLTAAFLKAREQAGEQVIGQEDFLSALTVAFKRPFVAGSEDGKPLGRCLVRGGQGTGRHTALKILADSLGRQGVLKSPKLAFLDLGRYGEPGTEKLFAQDLYAALKTGAAGLVFENFEKCHPSVLVQVSSLFQQGEAPLSGRYAEQKGMLVEIGTALVPGAVSTLSAGGKYLFLLTEKSEAKLADAFGMKLLSALDDICETSPFSAEAQRMLAEKALKELCEQAKRRLSMEFTYEPSAVEALLHSYVEKEGALSLEREADRLYKAMSEAKLRQGLEHIAGQIVGREDQLTACWKNGGQEVTLQAESGGGEEARSAAIADVKRELSEIVGLDEIKEYILSLEDNFKIQQLRKEKGLKAETPSMHMIFTGNPGTGKTTVARVVSRYLKAIGVLSGGQLIEVTRADLVGQYVGHTAPLTSKAIQSALGGVLFIDEAYSLYRGRDDSFGLEAIDTLVKGMEDHRDSLVVILAGYSYEMEKFLTANSGLKSRFPNVIEFPDYTAGELLDITKSIVKGKGYRLDEACEKPLLDFFEKAQREGDPRTNGNGRMARNKVEDAILNCSRRNVKTPEAEQDLELLKLEDFEL